MATNAEIEVENLKNELVNYKAGNINGKAHFHDAQPGEMDDSKIRIAIFGMAGSGKSALVNTIEKILLGREQGGTAMEQSAGAEGTVLLEEYLCQLGFTLIDTRGFFDYDCNEETELFRILYGTVQPGEQLERGKAAERKANMAGTAGYRLSKPPISDQVHVVLWVVKANDVRLTQGKYMDKFGFLRQQLGKEIITIVTVITHGDEIEKKDDPAAERESVKSLAREATGSIKPNTFLISNWLSENKEYDVTKKQEVLKMVRTALGCGERSVKMRQSKRELDKRQRQASEKERKPLKSPVQNTESPSPFEIKEDHCGRKKV